VRFSLLALFGVMTAAAVLLGMPGYVYLIVGTLALSFLALAAFVLLAEASIDSVLDLLQLFTPPRRPRRPDPRKK
jgi:hypothetical protein